MAATRSFLRSFLHFKTQQLSKSIMKMQWNTVGNQCRCFTCKTHHVSPWTLQRSLTWCQPKSAACIARAEDATNEEKVDEIRPKFRSLSEQNGVQLRCTEQLDKKTSENSRDQNQVWFHKIQSSISRLSAALCRLQATSSTFRIFLK